jgi:hypothetical protein
VLGSWENVAVGLGTTAIAAGVALAVALAQIRSRRMEELRTRRIEAASEFAKRFAGAAGAVLHAIRQRGEKDAAGGDSRTNADHLVGELRPFLGPITLLLGADSQAAEKSSEARDALASAVAALWDSRWDDAASALEAAHARSRDFEQATLVLSGYSTR